jgi:hypothetical protein
MRIFSKPGVQLKRLKTGSLPPKFGEVAGQYNFLWWWYVKECVYTSPLPGTPIIPKKKNPLTKPQH